MDCLSFHNIKEFNFKGDCICVDVFKVLTWTLREIEVHDASLGLKM